MTKFTPFDTRFGKNVANSVTNLPNVFGLLLLPVFLLFLRESCVIAKMTVQYAPYIWMP